jgi:hypothetical protein
MKFRFHSLNSGAAHPTFETFFRKLANNGLEASVEKELRKIGFRKSTVQTACRTGRDLAADPLLEPSFR